MDFKNLPNFFLKNVRIKKFPLITQYFDVPKNSKFLGEADPPLEGVGFREGLA
jgi:hypothetical protein